MVTEKRAGGEVETEATIKVEVDGERYLRVAEGNGPVNALDRALRGAIADRYPHLADIELTNYKVRILDEAHGTGAVTRVLLDSADGDARVGDDRRLGEHHRGLLGGAGRLAGVRLPMSDAAEPDPARRAGDRHRARRSWCSRCCAPAGSRWGRLGERFERELAAWLGVEDAVAVSSGTTALHLGVRALGWGPGDEVLTSPFSFVASANCLLYEGARPVFCDVDPVTLNLDPAAAAAAVGGAHRRASCRSTSSATRRRWRSWRRSPPGTSSAILEDACEAIGAVDSEGRGSAPAATSRPSPSTPTSR